ncbi:uncharacterized protein ppp1r32 [Cheilinus undulatus]|uniref:uncharacterized protein ppp1r32 n=1 Tax=Cheilinus undulatus TaxID=241271 RepID=UPI001BD33660|nr:uncharacterized protein ppp1r32 [Cheilinus undulatus]
MDEQGRIGMPAGAATGSRGQQTSDKLYTTSYMEVNFMSFLSHPSSSGFTANNRPAIYYNPSLDFIDNPHMGLVLSDNYMTQTKRHYQAPVHADGFGSSPNLLNKSKESGFHQLKCHPKAAILEKKTEYQRMYEAYYFTPTVPQKHVIIGPKTESGFTKETDRQPRQKSMAEPPQTYSSVMKTDFNRPLILQDNVARPSLCGRSCQDSGFTRGAITPLAHDTRTIQPSKTKSNGPTMKSIGKKEPTGSLSNASNDHALPDIACDDSHFTTLYESTFCQKSKSGRACTGVIRKKMDYGYGRRDMDRFILRD